jgi:hypothetical protein
MNTLKRIQSEGVTSRLGGNTLENGSVAAENGRKYTREYYLTRVHLSRRIT